MKINKYVTVFLAVAAMASTFVSCNRDHDITGNPMADHTQSIDGKQDYWIVFSLSNPGSLTPEAQSTFTHKIVEVIYPDDWAAGAREIKPIEHPMYVTEDYAFTNFNKVAALPNEESDIVQKIMIPTFCVDTVGGICHDDFEVSMTLSKDSMRTVLGTFKWSAKTAFNGQEIISRNRR